MLIRNLTLAMLLTLASSAPTRADLVVEVGDLLLAAGGVGYVDVSIWSDDPSGDLLSSFGFEFRIETAGQTRLEFVDPQPDSQLNDPDYVLSGDSLDLGAGLPVGVVAATVVPGDTFIGGDATDSGGDVLITSSRLLVRLLVTAATAAPPSPLDQFTILLASGPNTMFYDGALSSIDYVATPGSVTIASIPEPSSLAMFAVGSLALLGPAARCVLSRASSRASAR